MRGRFQSSGIVACIDMCCCEMEVQDAGVVVMGAGVTNRAGEASEGAPKSQAVLGEK